MNRPAKKGAPQGEILVCTHSKAFKQYEIDERIETGVVLMGSEVKSLRAKKADLDGSYAAIIRGELWLHKMHIGPYEQAGSFGHEPKRSRKLLAHKHEIEKLEGKLTLRGFTLIPTRVYFKNGRCKIELGLGKSRHVSDDREGIRRAQDLREARDALNRGRR
jgi:SsrA-binding protein